MTEKSTRIEQSDEPRPEPRPELRPTTVRVRTSVRAGANDNEWRYVSVRRF
jgi:hypothetical protein